VTIGALLSAKRQTLGGLIKSFLEEFLPKKSLAMQRVREHQLRWWKKKLGTYLLSCISPAMIIVKRRKTSAFTTCATPTSSHCTNLSHETLYYSTWGGLNGKYLTRRTVSACHLLSYNLESASDSAPISRRRGTRTVNRHEVVIIYRDEVP
jgi:hypothetical protein